MARKTSKRSTLWNSVTRLFGPSLDHSPQRTAKRRPLRFEPLETRQLLSADVLGSIAGVAYSDLTGNGLTADDVRLPNVTVKLYRDTGNSTFDSAADTLLTSVQTNSTGGYRFDSLTPGTYFVQQSTAAGYVISAGQDVGKVVITQADLAGANGVVIDSFSTASQAAASFATGRIATSSVAAASDQVIGGHRDLYVELTSAHGSVALGANTNLPNALEFSAGWASNGTRRVIWDGTGGDPATVNPTGLNADLTSAGASTGIKVTVGGDHGGSLLLKIYTDSTHFSTVTIPITAADDGASTQSLFVPFSTFAVGTGASAAADFTKVGAIQLDITGTNALDGELDSLLAVGPKVYQQNFINSTEADLAIVKSDSGSAIAGGQLTYTLKTTNSGPSKATEVTIVDAIPAGLSYVSGTSTQGTVTVANGVVTVNVGELASGASATATIRVSIGAGVTGNITNTATVDGKEFDPRLDNNTSTITTAVAAQTNLGIVKLGNPSQVVAGNQLTYTLTSTNSGPSNATGVTVTDTLPAGVTYVSSSGQGSVTSANGVITVGLGNVATGQSMTTTIVVAVAPETRGTLTNTARITGNESDSDLSNNTSSVQTPVVTQDDVAITKTASTSLVKAGNQLTYTLNVVNKGPSAATGVTISDTLPPGVTYVSGTSTLGTPIAANGTVTIAVGNLAVGGTATVTIVVAVDSQALGTLTNTATVTGNETDSDPSNNTATAITNIDVPIKPVGDPDIDLAVVKRGNPTSLNSGGTLTYTLTITNYGIGTATNVHLVDTLPAGVTIVSVHASQGTTVRAAGVVQAYLGTLARNATATVTVVVTPYATVSHAITNSATVSGDQNDSNLANNSASAQTMILVPELPSSKRRFLGR